MRWHFCWCLWHRLLGLQSLSQCLLLWPAQVMVGFWLQQYEWPKTVLFPCLSPPPSFFYWKENIFWMLRYFFSLKGIFIHYLRISHVLMVCFDHICPHHASFHLLPDLPSTPPNIIHPFFKICVFSLEFHTVLDLHYFRSSLFLLQFFPCYPFHLQCNSFMCHSGNIVDEGGGRF